MKLFVSLLLGIIFWMVETILARPVVKYSHGWDDDYKFGSWDEDGYCFARSPGLGRFKLDHWISAADVKIIGIRNERCGTNVWFRQGGFFDYRVTGVELPTNTTYGSFARVKYNGRDRTGCVTQTKKIEEASCGGIPVLRGFSVEYTDGDPKTTNDARNVDRIKVEVKKSNEETCQIEMEACLHDYNHDDPFEAYAYYAIVPDTKVAKFNQLVKGKEKGWDVDQVLNSACDRRDLPCNSEAVLTGFELELTSGWPGHQDMDLDEIEVGVQVYHDDYVMALVSYNDNGNDDEFEWKVQYALIK